MKDFSDPVDHGTAMESASARSSQLEDSPTKHRGRLGVRLGLLGVASILPASWTPWVLRNIFGYRIGPGVRIGLSIIEARSCEIGGGTVIGHGNLFLDMGNLKIGAGCRIGHLNLFRGGSRVSIGDNTKILRLNVINSMHTPVAATQTEATFSLGDGSAVTEGHRIDFTDRVSIGTGTVLAGRHSSLWTHARDEYGPIEIGNLCYIGSESRFAPNSRIPSDSVVGMGSVVVAEFDTPGFLIGGVPARILEALDEDKRSLLRAVGERNSKRRHIDAS